MGESPTRPGIFQARPLVVVTPQISPLALIPSQLMVPWTTREWSSPSSNSESRIRRFDWARWSGSR